MPYSPMPTAWARALAALVLASMLVGSARAQDAAAVELFEAKVRPLLIRECQTCHSTEARKGGLSLESRAAILEGGDSGPAAVPGEPEESLLIEAIRHDSEPRMPPRKKLSGPEIAALTRWVELGMPWPETSPGLGQSAGDHWAFQPVKKVDPPDVANPTWVRNSIDRFVLARLEAEGLRPAAEADRRTLIRRLSYDLIGLPPTPEEVSAFEADPAEDAYERLVDRLLASPHHGEHWGRHWLDVARYSDTKGYVYGREEKFWVHAWAYRDWVVAAINRDLPYDRFLFAQIAGDQMDGARPDDLAALGFLTIGRRFLGVTHDVIDDRIDVVSRGALGLTVACARCHDHKFDPISQRDYYSLYGIFRNSVESLVSMSGETVAEDTPFGKGFRERSEKLRETMAKERAAAADRVRHRLGDYLTAQLELQKYPEEGFDQIFEVDDLIPAYVRRWRDRIARSADDPIFAFWQALQAIEPTQFEPQGPTVAAELARRPAEAANPRIARAFLDHPPKSMRDVATTYAQVFEEALKQDSADPALTAIRQFLLDPDSPCEVPDESIYTTEGFFPTAVCEALWRLQGDVDRWLIQSGEAPPHALVLRDREHPTNSRIFLRGNPARPGDEVARRPLELLAGPNPSPFSDGSGRLGLARTIIDPANPLTARVMVNRVWMNHFGAGLARTAGDFGTRAEPPSHPELLDWLASRFIEDGWGLKALHRRIVLSATYRQASTGNREVLDKAVAIDPENRLLWHHRPDRLSFEMLRDASLAVTGDLDDRIGGKPAPLFQAPFPKRRTLYGMIDREDLPGVLRAFDFANPDLLIPQRAETTVPQQALYLLNNPFPIERARALATSTSGTDSERIESLYRRAYQRPPTAAEVSHALEFLRQAAEEPTPVPPPHTLDWRYGWGKVDESSGSTASFQPLPHFNGHAWQGGPRWPDSTLGWAQLTAEGGHAGNDRDHAAVRRWTAPRDGRYRVRSELIHESTPGDGIRGFLVVQGRGVVASATLHNQKARLDGDDFALKAGETIDFAVDIRDNLTNDEFRWPAAVEDVGIQEAWNSSTDFRGPAEIRLTPWEQLAQALMMSNEFTYVE